ncbi:unnamed protein product [Pleuronectes platessa]|uniref:Uncharacterized protein n=1 Tax=Pleuronectes platessa TaxID=8262 RepID=A0A9N7UBX9_PLEPL|nr:unnamed protein product [Pleuronectes platessa]
MACPGVGRDHFLTVRAASEVSFTRCTRDKLVQSIQDIVRRSFTPSVLMEKISCFAVDLMKFITTIATKNISPPAEPAVVLEGEGPSQVPTSSCDSSCCHQYRVLERGPQGQDT